MIGSAIGGYVDPTVITGPKLTDPQRQTSSDGVPRPIVYGTAAIMGNVIQVQSVPTEHKHSERQGKGGPVQETFTYTRTVAFRICEAAPLGGEMQLRRAWVNGKLGYDATGTGSIDADSAKFIEGMTFYSGSEAQLPNADLEALPAEDGGGVGNVPAYRGTCYAVLRDCDVSNGGALPQIRWEVTSQATATDNCSEYSTDAVYYFPLNDAAGGGVAAELIQGLDGVYSANCASGPPLRAGSTGSLYMESISDYMLANHVDVFRINGNSGWTISAWCKPTDISGGSVLKNVATVWSSTFAGTRNYSLCLRSTNNMVPTAQFSLDGTNSESLGASEQLAVNQIAFMTCTYIPDIPGGTNGTYKFYVNGALIDTAASAAPNWGGQFLAVGGYDYPSSYGFVGYVSDVAVWDRAFSDAEVQAKYWATSEFYALPDIAGAYVNADGSIVSVCLPTVTPGTLALSDVVGDLIERAGVTDYDVSALASDTVRGFAITQPTDAAGAIRALQPVYFFDLPEWGNSGDTGTKLRAVKRGGASVLTLTDDDLVDADDDEDTRAQAVEFPLKVNLMAPDPDASYEVTKQTAERTSENVKATGEANISTAVIFSKDERAQIADISQKVAWEEQAGRSVVTVPEEFTQYVTSDIITRNEKRFRIDAIRQGDGQSRWELTRDRASAYSSNATAGDVLAPPSPASSIRGPTLCQVLNLPSLRSGDNVPGVYVPVCGLLPGWIGCDLYLSVDAGVTEQKVATLIDPAVMGKLSADMTTGDVTLAVTLYNDDELDTVTLDQLAARLNGAAVTSSGVSEVLQFQTATDTGAKAYDLTDLTRGELDTTEAAHSTGDDFVLLDQAVAFIPIDVSHAGETLIFRPVSRGTLPANNPTVSIVFDPPTFVFDGGGDA